MQLGMVGLGRMGANIVRRLLKAGHECVVYDVDADAVKTLEGEGATGADSMDDFVAKLQRPRAAWVMVPAGSITHQTVAELAQRFESDDIIIDGGNTFYRDDIERAKGLIAQGIHYVDVGTSGGVWGLEVGYCMMVGGSQEAVDRVAPILDVLAPPDGWGHMGDAGAGHYVKMVHNGVEYGMMQAYAEGFEAMHAADYDLDMGQIARLWNHASVVRSWLCELAANAFEAEGNDLERLEGWVADSGEGRWTIEDAMAHDVPTPVITAALYARFYSRRNGDYTARVLAALRNQFGGHAVRAAAGDAPGKSDEAGS